MSIRPDIDLSKQEQAESTAEDYLTWRDAKVRKALAEARSHPEDGLSQAEVWKKFGIEP